MSTTTRILAAGLIAFAAGFVIAQALAAPPALPAPPAPTALALAFDAGTDATESEELMIDLNQNGIGKMKLMFGMLPCRRKCDDCDPECGDVPPPTTFTICDDFSAMKPVEGTEPNCFTKTFEWPEFPTGPGPANPISLPVEVKVEIPSLLPEVHATLGG